MKVKRLQKIHEETKQNEFKIVSIPFEFSKTNEISKICATKHLDTFRKYRKNSKNKTKQKITKKNNK